MDKNLKTAIIDKYISPTRQERERRIGIEIELPVVRLDGSAVQESAVVNAAAAFGERFSFEPVSRDSDGNVYSMLKTETGDDLSFDCSFTNLELSLGTGSDLFEIKARFETYFMALNDLLSESGHMLTGMGINPGYKTNANRPVPNERYLMLDRFLKKAAEYKTSSDGRLLHGRNDFGYFTSASQVQLDVGYDELTDVLNVFGRLEPYKVLLFANSFCDELPQLLCARNYLWENSMQGYDPHNVGMFDTGFESVDDVAEYIASQSMYSVMRGSKWLDFEPLKLTDYFAAESIEAEYFDGSVIRQTVIKPDISDLKYHRTFKFEDLTFRGTVEFRSGCTQPVRDSMTIAAFHTGLIERLSELKELLYTDRVIYHHGYRAAELQRMFSGRELPGFVDKALLTAQLKKILDISTAGLKARGHGEDTLLAPLYERAQKLESPAGRMLAALENGESLCAYIEEYGRL
ncbi:MAG: glutamylcysteine synthetase [Ruminococcus sp.]|nr:glutamylcysteine synthetase [Ruminococcus sp.]